jgi:hypothetical protein
MAKRVILKPDGTVIDYTMKPLGTVTRTWRGEKLEWITRCPKCGRHGSRGAFIPEKSAARGGSVPFLTHVHRAIIVDRGIRYMHVTDSCNQRITPENVDDLLNERERAQFYGMDRYLAEFGGWSAQK